MGSWVLTPRASVATTAGRVKRRASVWEQTALAEVRAGTDVSVLLFGRWAGCVKRWSSYCNATEIDMNILSLWFRDQAQPQICSCIFKVSYTTSQQTKWVLPPSHYSCKILFWWGKRCCRLEGIYDSISVIFLYRGVYMNKEQASLWQGIWGDWSSQCCSGGQADGALWWGVKCSEISAPSWVMPVAGWF